MSTQITIAGGVGSYHGNKVIDNSAAPSSDTDLDISSIVGVCRAFVFIKVKDRSSNVRRVGFKAKGDTDTSYTSTDANCGGVYIGSGNSAYIIATTDAFGVLSWRMNSTGNVDVWVISSCRLE